MRKKDQYDEVQKMKHTNKDTEPKYEPNQRMLDEVRKRVEERMKEIPPAKKSET